MNIDIVEAVTQIAKERNISRDTLSEILENIFLAMIKRKYGTTDNFDIFVNMDKGEVEIYQAKTIVEEVTDSVMEIDLEKAQEVEPDLELGDEFVEIIDPSSFGRRLITSAKQGLNQKIREAEKEILFAEFKDRIGEIVIGDVRQINRDEILISVDHMEVSLVRSEQIYNERWHRGDTIRAVIKEVSQTTRGPEVIVSRTDSQFLIRLFEIEVPEIYDGIIEIKRVARFPGDRAKVAVASNDKRIDAVGACVGLKGVRIQSIVKELNNEKIDVINWSSEPEIFISRSLSPARPLRMSIDQDAKKATAIISDDQISLAIGRGGQNRQLASMLTGYEITTVKESEWELGEAKEEKLPLSDVTELSKPMIEKLTDAGYETADDILDASREELLAIKGIGEKTIDKIVGILNTYYEEESEEEAEEKSEQEHEEETTKEEIKKKAGKKSKKEPEEETAGGETQEETGEESGQEPEEKAAKEETKKKAGKKSKKKPEEAVEEKAKEETDEKSEHEPEEETIKKETKKKTGKKSKKKPEEKTAEEKTKEEAEEKSGQEQEEGIVKEETKEEVVEEDAGALDSKDES
jgi:N utilization substance protein A